MSCPILRFGAFEFDVDAGELRKHGMRVRLAGQPLQILLLLLERPGEVVTAEELRQKLWRGDSAVDVDVGLSTAVRKLRDVLRDSARKPRFIETLPRRGYRFIAPVLSLEAHQAAEPPPSKHLRWIAAGFALAMILAVVVIVQRPVVTPRSIKVLPFENLTGDPSQNHFVGAVTDSLAANLAHVKGLRVLPASSNVDAIVEGSVRRTGERIQVSVRLIRASTDQLIWARRYQGELRNAATLQREIARDVADAIGSANRR